MPRYDLDSLGHEQFKLLSQTLVKAVIGSGTITFGDGPDGGREATFQGKAQYPSKSEQWNGFWIFQAKFHDTKHIGLEKAREQILLDLKKELYKIIVKYKRKCDNYILVTNVPLSSVNKKGTHDQIENIVNKYKNCRNTKYHVPSHVHVWGADDVSRLLEIYNDVRKPYLSFITPGDLIAELLERLPDLRSNLAETIKMYISTCFNKEQYALLDQAGEVSDERILLKKVFVDLDININEGILEYADLRSLQVFQANEEPISFSPLKQRIVKRREPIKTINKRFSDLSLYTHSPYREGTTSAMELFLGERLKKLILIGGPGQGKSTLCQFLVQIHRSTLLGEAEQLCQNFGLDQNMTPIVARVPFRIILKEYAQWITTAPKNNESIEHFLVYKIRERTTRTVSTEEIQSIFRNNPCLLILDGIDEVTNLSLQDRMFDDINDFLFRCEKVLDGDLQVIATSRPTGYRQRLDDLGFVRLTLANMNKKRVVQYAERWTTAKLLDEEKTKNLLTTINECLDDPQIQPLTNTPLQATILILIILTGGTPPKQREALFDEYLDIIYRREKTKAKWIMQTEKRLLFGLHKYLGYVLHVKAAGKQNVRSAIKEEEFIQEVRNYVTFNDKYSSQNTFEELIDQIVKEARDRLVLIVELEPGLFGFELRSLQEFFAAAHLADTAKDTTKRYERFEAIARPAHWRNVTLLFAGRIGRLYGGEASNIIEICKEIDRAEPDSYLKTGAWLGLEIAADRCFVPNRNLQRSIIEYSLSLLDGDFVDKKTALIEALGKLQIEDMNDHVKPLLEDKLARSRFSTAKSISEVYHVLFGLTEQTLAIMDVYLSSTSREEVNWALEKSLEYQAPADWLAKRISKTVDKMSPKSFAEIFGRPLFVYPSYVKKCLQETLLDSEKISAVSNHLFSEFYFSHYSIEDQPILSEHIELTAQNLLWNEVSIFRMLALLEEKLYDNFRKRGYNYSYNYRNYLGQFSPSTWIAISEMLSKESKKFLASLPVDTMLSLPTDIVSSKTKLGLFILQLLSVPYQHPKLEEFVAFFHESVEKDEELGQILYKWIKQTKLVCAFPSTLALKLQKKQHEIPVHVNQLYEASEIGLKELYPILSKRKKSSKKDIIRTIKLIEKAISDKEIISTSLQSLLDDSWNLDADIIGELEELVDFVLKNYSSGDKNAQFLVVQLFWKMLKMAADETLTTVYGIEGKYRLSHNVLEVLDDSRFRNQLVETCNKCPENIKIQGFSKLYYKLLTAIGQKNVGFFASRNSNPTEAVVALLTLSRYVGSTDDNEINAGATKISSALYTDIMFHIVSWEQPTLDKVRNTMNIKQEKIMECIDNNVRRSDYIRILTYSHFTISENIDWLSKNIQKVQSPSECSSWLFLIHFCSMESNSKSVEISCQFLSAVMKDITINPLIREAALQRYSKLCQIGRSADKIDDKKLQLPL